MDAHLPRLHDVLAQGRLPDEHPIGAYSHAQLIGVPGTASVHEAVQAMRIEVDLESTRTSPMFNPSELSGSMYLAQHEP